MNDEQQIPFITTIFITPEEEYVCNSCANEKAGQFIRMNYEVIKDVHVVFCVFCQAEVPNPLTD
jgi:hypothetical protein